MKGLDGSNPPLSANESLRTDTVACCCTSLLCPRHMALAIWVRPLQCGEGFYRSGDSVALAARIHRFHGIVVGRLRREVVQVHAEDRR